MIAYKEAFFDEITNTLCIIMEIADGGDLMKLVDKMKKKRKGCIPVEDVWRYTVQMLRGLKAMHDNKICHRDLKCANIFLTKSG